MNEHKPDGGDGRIGGGSANVKPVEVRCAEFLKRWLARPEFKAALHRHDREKDNGI